MDILIKYKHEICCAVSQVFCILNVLFNMLIQLFFFLADTSDNIDNTHSTLSHYDSDHEDYHDLYDDVDEGSGKTDKVPVSMIGDNGNKTGKRFIYSL